MYNNARLYTTLDASVIKSIWNLKRIKSDRWYPKAFTRDIAIRHQNPNTSQFEIIATQKFHDER